MATDETVALIAFYAARLDEEEAAAFACIRGMERAKFQKDVTLPPRWVAEPGTSDIRSEDGILRVRHTWVHEREHIVRHDPARTLQEVQRGRRMVERYTLAAQAVQRGSVSSFRAGQDSGYAEACLDAIKEAAAVDDGHPDYLPAWRP